MTTFIVTIRSASSTHSSSDPGLNEAGFARVQPKDTGRPAYYPADLLKLYIYGHVNRVRSSRGLETETGRNLESTCRPAGRRHHERAAAWSSGCSSLGPCWRGRYEGNAEVLDPRRLPLFAPTALS
jgi:hypothetical protein